MGWYSGKKSIYKLNQLRLSKTQQEEFLRSHLKMNTRQIKELKEKLGNKALPEGKLLTASQWQKIMQEHEPNIKEKWQEFVKQKDKEYQSYLEEVKKENIKKVKEMERKQEVTDKMIKKLTGREKLGSWREKIKKSIVADRIDVKNSDLTPAAQRVLRKKEELINRKKPNGFTLIRVRPLLSMSGKKKRKPIIQIKLRQILTKSKKRLRNCLICIFN